MSHGLSIFPKGWGDYPPEYNREIHGPYDPSVYYGKRDKPFSEVKLCELGAWISRRNKSPRAMAQAISRAWWRWQLNWVSVRKPGPACYFQLFAGCSLLFYIGDYSNIKKERWYRYH